MDYRTFVKKFPNVSLVFLVDAIRVADQETLECLSLAFGYGRCAAAFASDIESAFASESHEVRNMAASRN